MRSFNLFQEIETISSGVDRIAVFFSGGKDSICALDLCARYIPLVRPVFMQLGPVLSFQRNIISWVENRYQQPVVVIPHPMLLEWLKYGLLRVNPDYDIPLASFADVYNYSRILTGCWWLAGGERINDSIVRRAMIKGDGGCINAKRGKTYPLARWSKQDVVAYIRHNRLMVGLESSLLGFSFRSLMPADLSVLKQKMPRDYADLKRWFPLVDAAVALHKFSCGDN